MEKTSFDLRPVYLRLPKPIGADLPGLPPAASALFAVAVGRIDADAAALDMAAHEFAAAGLHLAEQGKPADNNALEVQHKTRLALVDALKGYITTSEAAFAELTDALQKIAGVWSVRKAKADFGGMLTSRIDTARQILKTEFPLL